MVRGSNPTQRTSVLQKKVTLRIFCARIQTSEIRVKISSQLQKDEETESFLKVGIEPFLKRNRVVLSLSAHLGCYYRVGHFDETVSPPCLKDAKTSHS